MGNPDLVTNNPVFQLFGDLFARKPRTSNAVISHWSHLEENFNTSSLDFYAAVEEALKRREVPDIDTVRILFLESGAFSAKREYLRVQRGQLTFDICAAPYGTGFFFSWWLSKQPSSHRFLKLCCLLIGPLLLAYIIGRMFGMEGIGTFVSVVLLFPATFFLSLKAVEAGMISSEDEVLDVPIIGWFYEVFIAPQTYYRLDTIQMYQECVRHAVNEVVEQVRNAQGLHALTAEEKRPRLRDLAR